MNWLIKYAPKSLDEVVNQENAKLALKRFVFNFKKGKALLLYGPAGVGKTCSVYALAHQYNFEIVELNASDTRNATKINKILGAATQYGSIFGKKRIILVDEVDGITRDDRGGLTALTRMIQNSSIPIILTANDPWDQKLRPLRNLCEMVEFKPLSYRDILKRLRFIAERENIKVEEGVLEVIAKRSRGDLRAAILDFQAIVRKGEVKKEYLNSLGFREKEETIFEALKMIFKTKSPFVAMEALNYVDIDLDEAMLWIEENIPNEYEDIREIWKAFENLSRASVFLGRITRWQYWGFLVYANILATAGVALSKREMYHKFTRYRRPFRLQKLYQMKNYRDIMKSIAKNLGEKCHVSIRDAQKIYIPYLKKIFQNNKEMAEKLKKQLELDEEEVKFLMMKEV